MRLLFVLKDGVASLSISLRSEYAKDSELDIVDLSGEVDYKGLLDMVESSEKLLSL